MKNAPTSPAASGTAAQPATTPCAPGPPQREQNEQRRDDERHRARLEPPEQQETPRRPPPAIGLALRLLRQTSLSMPFRRWTRRLPGSTARLPPRDSIASRATSAPRSRGDGAVEDRGGAVLDRRQHELAAVDVPDDRVDLPEAERRGGKRRKRAGDERPVGLERGSDALDPDSLVPPERRELERVLGTSGSACTCRRRGARRG